MFKWKGYLLIAIFLLLALWALISIFILTDFKWDKVICNQTIDAGKKDLERAEARYNVCTQALESAVNIQVRMFQCGTIREPEQNNYEKCDLESSE